MNSNGFRQASFRLTATGALLATGLHSAQAIQTHVLQKGESLSKLARIYHVSIDDIVKANHLPNQDALHEGTRLIIPDPPKHVIVPATMHQPAKIHGDRIKVRIGPGTDQRLLEEFDMGAPLLVTAEQNGWFQVTLPDNRHGWVRKDYIQLSGPSSGQVAHNPHPGQKQSVPVGPHLLAVLPNDPQRKRSANQVVKVRTSGSKKHQEIQHPTVQHPTVQHATVHHSTVHHTNSHVAHTKHVAGKHIAARHVAVKHVADSPATHHAHHMAKNPGTSHSTNHSTHHATASYAPPESSDIVRTAYAYRGTPYHYGGTGRSGFDCSGFTSYLYQKKGVSLPHNAAAQYSRGVHISKSDLKPGDLVFFHCGRRGISHVGMYVGNGNFVHASSPHSGGVRVDSLNDGYYSRTYRGAARVKK